MNIHNPFTLPELEFVGGATQELVFHCYHKMNDNPSDLSYCTANFAIINYVNKFGSPRVSKDMTIQTGSSKDGNVQNVLSVTLDKEDTVELQGKYIYQITIRDITGAAEIPGQGLIHINNNINKKYVS